MTKYKKAGATMQPPERERLLGPPHWHGWNAILLWLKAQVKGTSEAPIMEDYLTRRADAIGSNPLSAYRQEVRFVKVATAFDKKNIKLLVSVVHGSPSHVLWGCVARRIQAVGARLTTGVAPPGWMAQQMQQYLDGKGKSKEGARQGPQGQEQGRHGDVRLGGEPMYL